MTSSSSSCVKGAPFSVGCDAGLNRNSSKTFVLMVIFELVGSRSTISSILIVRVDRSNEISMLVQAPFSEQKDENGKSLPLDEILHSDASIGIVILLDLFQTGWQ